MKTHYTPPEVSIPIYGETVYCDSPLFNEGTLFKVGDRGLVVVQMHWDPNLKAAFWGPVDYWVANDIYVHMNFLRVFDKLASDPGSELYPTISVRSLMWALRMKPLKKDIWEDKNKWTQTKLLPPPERWPN